MLHYVDMFKVCVEVKDIIMRRHVTVVCFSTLYDAIAMVMMYRVLEALFEIMTEMIELIMRIQISVMSGFITSY